MADLNLPISVDEVACVLRGMSSGKAADVMGLTCELLSVPSMSVPAVTTAEGGRGLSHNAPWHPGGLVVFQPVVTCITPFLQHIVTSNTMPTLLQVSKLIPVPKPADRL
jgi:hypothetical protein